MVVQHNREPPAEAVPYARCVLCPRQCGVNRAGGERGYCGETGELRLASASIHRGEEPPLVGRGGSGTVFVSGCNLGCVFCQNRQISRGPPGRTLGRVVGEAEFAGIVLALQERGAENINLVTGSHAAPALAAGIRAARSRGLTLPVLWNSSAYEGPDTLALLKDTADVFLPDLKTLDSGISARYFKAPDYPETAEAAILRMLEMRELRFSGETLVSGVIVRHLVLPGEPESTREVLRWFARHARERALLSLMTQYTPVAPGPERPLNEAEYRRVLDWLEEFGIEEGFFQELEEGGDTGWFPDFNRENPFTSQLPTGEGLSTPVWHWKRGFTGRGSHYY
ncbi:radical SAM protein [Spirochaetia bacterium]|nr:radical SAM protein [Spirochaetia bacterium]